MPPAPRERQVTPGRPARREPQVPPAPRVRPARQATPGRPARRERQVPPAPQVRPERRVTPGRPARRERQGPPEPQVRPARRVTPGQPARREPQGPRVQPGTRARPERLVPPARRERRVPPARLEQPGTPERQDLQVRPGRREQRDPRARPVRGVRPEPLAQQEPLARRVTPERRDRLVRREPPGRTGPQGGTGTGIVTLNGSTGGTFTDETVIIKGPVTSGTFTLNNATLIFEGGANGNVTVNMQSGVDTVDIVGATSNAGNNPTIENLASSDSIGIGQHYSAPPVFSGFVGGQINFKTGGSGVNFSVTLANFLDDTFFNGVSQNTIDGKTYYVATLDPPAVASGRHWWRGHNRSNWHERKQRTNRIDRHGGWRDRNRRTDRSNGTAPQSDPGRLAGARLTEPRVPWSGPGYEVLAARPIRVNRAIRGPVGRTTISWSAPQAHLASGRCSVAREPGLTTLHETRFVRERPGYRPVWRPDTERRSGWIWFVEFA